ncbi:MAG TPA: HAMP domain-containing protein [Desulfitobacterium dehalogenans]|uniref:histidine kinase n=1 Tax=Desulfitobacterium dehalogenans TaxID=36854 RepID=A0A7C7D8W1_9FIRM|nr:HAMP domain-containing protein [Desulfitobacterium dehalogenans]
MKENSIPWWMRIKVHFLLFGIAMSILPLFFLGYLGFTSVRQNLQMDIYEQNFDQVSVLAREIQDAIATIENSLTFTKTTTVQALTGSDETLRQLILETLLQKEPSLKELKVYDTNFRSIAQINRQASAPPNSSTNAPESILTSEDLSPISDLYFSQEGQPEIRLTVAIQDPMDGKFLGHLQGTIELTTMINRYLNFHLDEGKYVFLVDRSGTLIGQTDSDLHFHQEDLRQDPAVQSFMAGELFSTGSEYKNFAGVNVIGAFASMDTLNWGVFIEQPAHEANKPIFELALRLIMIAVLIMVLVMIISISFGLKVVHPIENLESQVRRIIQTGDLESHIPIESWDEIGRLVKSFNQLLNSLDQKNENLKNEKELLTTVVDGVGAGMVLLDSERTILWWNTKFAQWFGQELANLPCEQVIAGQGTEDILLENGRTISVFLHEERRHFRQMYYELSPDNPENAAYLLLLDDVTQEVEMEARMIETDKMAAIGLLASGVAHEINNPLAVVAAYSEDLLERLNEEDSGPSQEEIKLGFDTVLEQIVRCKQITDGLLGFARKRDSGSDLIDIGIASSQTLGLLEHKAKQKHLHIQFHSENSLFVLGNENEWQQVVLNLVTNALDASSEGDTIDVRGYREGNTIQFIIQDYGEGIPQDHLKKAYDPFFTTKSPGQGTGLGLYVSYGIIVKMHGEMTLESTEGQGTKVNISLPFHEAGEQSS